MNRDRNPLMIAYIIFLVICCFIYIMKCILDFEFEIWDKIVVATTASSYFFSFASLHKNQIQLHNNMINYYNGIIPTASEENSLFQKLFDTYENNEQLTEDVKLIENKYTPLTEYICKAIEEEKEEIKIEEKWVFRFNVTGFLMFFCVIAFNFVFSFLKSHQDIITICAFIMVLVADYSLDYFSNKGKLAIDNLEKDIKNNIKKLEGKCN